MNSNSKTTVSIEDIQVGTTIFMRRGRWTGRGWSQAGFIVTSLHIAVANPAFVADGRETPCYMIHADLKSVSTGKSWRGTFYLYKGNLKGSAHKIADWNERAAHYRHQELLAVTQEGK